MGFLTALSVLLLIIIGGLSTLGVSNFNAGKKAGREKAQKRETKRAEAESRSAQKMMTAQANAPKTKEELSNRLKKGTF